MSGVHHGPWCDEADSAEDMCPACAEPLLREELMLDAFLDGLRPRPVPCGNGPWLLARLAVHYHYNRVLRVNQQDPIWGAELNAADRLEVSRLALELAHARKLAGMGPEARRAYEHYMREVR